MALDLSTFHGPAGCLEVLKRRPSVMLVGRSSCEAGKVAYQASVQDLMQAATALESITGIAVRSVMPTKDVFEQMLRDAPAVPSLAPDGRKFTNRTVQWSNHAEGIHVLLSAGSGRKVDENLLQPALARAAEVFRAVQPGLVFAKRIDRIGRRPWAFGPLMELLEQSGSWMGDEEGTRAPDEWTDLLVFLEATQGRHTAEGMPTMTRHGMASRTGTVMVDGRVDYHVAQPPPPGTTRLGMLSAGGGLGATLLVLDSPTYLPPDGQVATGMPQVFGSDGRRVDQVANVRWALSVLGRPEWSRRQVTTELARRQMSTSHLRGTHGREAVVQPPPPDATVFSLLNSILNNLHLYETGELKLALNVEGVADLLIRNVLPNDGPWATPEDFARIRGLLRNGKERRDRHRSLSLSSLSVSLSGQAGRLLTSAGRKSPEPGYVVALWDRPFGRQKRDVREPVVPHVALADSIVEAISNAGDTPLMLWQQSGRKDSHKLAEITRLEMSVDAIQTDMRTILMQVTALDESGAPRLSGRLLDDLNTEYSRLADGQLHTVENELAEMRKEVESSRLDQARQAGTAQAADLLRLLRGLRDPHDLSLAELWRMSIRDLAFTIRQEKHSSHTTDIVEWQGRIVFSDLSDPYAIPFKGTYRRGAGIMVKDRLAALVSNLAEGIPFDICDVERKPVLKPQLAARFGVPARQFLLGSCLDPRITRVAARLLLDPEQEDGILAAELKEPTDFIARIRLIYCDTARTRSAWLQRMDIIVTRWHVIAAENQGLVDSKLIAQHCASKNSATSALLASSHKGQWGNDQRNHYQLKPCKFCKGHRRAPMRIPEPVGLVCLDCRRDEKVLLWPADPYDQWRCAPHLWTDVDAATTSSPAVE